MSEHRIQKRGQEAVCLFCTAKLTRPRAIESTLAHIALTGGYCSCGSLFIFDASGKEGGQSLMDGLFLLCDGNMDAALALRPGLDYQLERVSYNPRLHTFEPQGRGHAFGQPKLWFMKLTPKT
jgi:hypothetical protein